MKTRAIYSIAGVVLTILIVLPILFVVTGSPVSTRQSIGIVAGVLALLLWTIPYATIVDPWLRRGVGAVFGTMVEWQGVNNKWSWTASQESGCLASLFIELLGYLFVILWLIPPASVIGFILWFHR